MAGSVLALRSFFVTLGPSGGGVIVDIYPAWMMALVLKCYVSAWLRFYSLEPLHHAYLQHRAECRSNLWREFSVVR